MSDHWIAVGGTGQDVTLVSASLALLGLVPTPENIFVIDADLNGDLTGLLTKAAGLVRARRFDKSGALRDPFVRIAPIAVVAENDAPTLANMYPGDRHIQAFYRKNCRSLDTRTGFKAEPQVGAAAFFQPAFDSNSPFRKELQNLHASREDRIWVFASVAGGTGAGLWQLVSRLTRLLAGDAKVNLVLLGPTVSLTGAEHDPERDADGNVLTNDRLVANAAAGFHLAREVAERYATMAEADRPFHRAYLVGHPDGHKPPTAAPSRTAARMSRIPVVAASVLALPEGQDGGVFMLADEVKTGSHLPGVRFARNFPMASLGTLVHQSLALLDQLLSAHLPRRASLLNPQAWRGLGQTLWQALQSGREIETLAHELQGVARDAHTLLTHLRSRLEHGAAEYPPPVPLGPKRGIETFKEWQEALGADEKPKENDPAEYLARRWIQRLLSRQVGQSQVEDPTGKITLTWVVPARSPAPQQLGWRKVDANTISTEYVTRPESYPTPYAQARWHRHHLSYYHPSGQGFGDEYNALTREARAKIDFTREQTLCLLKALMTRHLRIGSVKVARRDKVSKEGKPNIADVAIFLETEQLFTENQGGEPLSELQHIELASPLGGFEAGTLVGGIHPLCGPFLGPDFSALYPLLKAAVESQSARLNGLLGAWIKVLQLTNDVRSRLPWVRLLPPDLPTDAGTDAAPLEPPIRLAWLGGQWVGPQPRMLLPLPAPPAKVTLLKLVDRSARPRPDLLPCFPEAPGPGWQASWQPSEPTQAGEKFTFSLPGGEVVVEPVWRELTNWTIQVELHGEGATAAVNRYILSIQPGDGVDQDIRPNGARRPYEVAVHVELDGALRRLTVDGTTPGMRVAGDRTLRAAFGGRPRFLEIRRMDGATGCFPLLTTMARPDNRNFAQVAHVAIDFGTNRSCVAITATDLSPGRFTHQGKLIFAPTDDLLNPHIHEKGEALGHPLHRLPHAGLAPGYLREEGKPIRMALLPSALLVAGGAAPEVDLEPLVDFGLPPLTERRAGLFAHRGDLKWSGHAKDVEHYLLLLLLVALAELDEASGDLHKLESIRISYPQGFDKKQRDALRIAAPRAVARAAAIVGIPLPPPRFLDEATAAIWSLEPPREPFRLTADIGGGTVDFSLTCLPPDSTQSVLLATDSLVLGADLVVHGHLNRLYPDGSSNRDQRMIWFRRDVASNEFEIHIRSKGQVPLARPFIQTICEYAARLVVGVLRNVVTRRRPGWLTDAEWLAVCGALPREPGPGLTVPVYLLGAGWRLAGLDDFSWEENGSERIRAFFGDLLKRAAQPLLLGERVGEPPVRVPNVEFRPVFDRLLKGSEKAAIAIGMLHPYVDIEPNIPQLSGAKTINGLDEVFDGRPLPWHHWIGKDATAFRTTDAPYGATTATTVQATPTFGTLSHPADWALDRALLEVANELNSRLTPRHNEAEDVYGLWFQRTHRVRSVLSQFMRMAYRRKLDPGARE